MNLAQVGRIARREYLARVRSRAFIVVTALVPAIFAFNILVVPRMMQSRRTEVRVAVLDAGTGLGRPFADRLATIDRPHITIAQVATPNGPAIEREGLTAAVRDGELDGYFFLEPATDQPIGTRARYFSREVGDQELRREMASALRTAAVASLLEGTGVDVDRVRDAQRLDIGAVAIGARGERPEGFERAFVSTFALAMLLYMAVLINGQGMATAIVEEKSSRLIEVILGAVTAGEFMTGKIVGVLGSGLTQLAVWLGAAILLLVQALPGLDLAASAAGFRLGDFVTPALLGYFAIFFALGYLFYSVMFAAIAATSTSAQDLGQSMLVAVLPMVVGLMATMSVFNNPATTATRVLSLVPFFTPLVMLARVNILMPPLWEVWLGIALLLAATAAAAWVSAKIFRYALLMTGKRPTLPELVAVVRAR